MKKRKRIAVILAFILVFLLAALAVLLYSLFVKTKESGAGEENVSAADTFVSFVPAEHSLCSWFKKYNASLHV